MQRPETFQASLRAGRCPANPAHHHQHHQPHPISLNASRDIASGASYPKRDGCSPKRILDCRTGCVRLCEPIDTRKRGNIYQNHQEKNFFFGDRWNHCRSLCDGTVVRSFLQQRAATISSLELPTHAPSVASLRLGMDPSDSGTPRCGSYRDFPCGMRRNTPPA